MSALDRISRLLASIGAPYALIGGRAVAVRGYPRMTLDYDFLTSDSRILEPGIWQTLEAEGVQVDRRRGEFDDPIAGVVHITFEDGVEADVLLAKWKWEAEILERAEPLDLGGAIVPVPITSDLILLKLAAGGPIDLQDVIALVTMDRARLMSEVDEKVHRVLPDVSDAWQFVKDSLAG